MTHSLDSCSDSACSWVFALKGVGGLSLLPLAIEYTSYFASLACLEA